MGRIKQGLDYFPLNTDFMHDRVVRRVMKREGDSAFTILLYTLSYIYSGEGYYILVNDDFYDELSDQLFSTDNDHVRRVLRLFVEYGFFDSTLYERHGVLTSVDVQRQFLFITKRRSHRHILPAYCLLADESEQPEEDLSAPDTVAETVDTVYKKPDNANSIPGCCNKNDLHKKKEKERKENIHPNPPCEGGDEEGGDSSSCEKVPAVASGAKAGSCLQMNSGSQVNHSPQMNPVPWVNPCPRVKKTSELTQADIDCMCAPADGCPRNLSGLLDSLRLYRIPPSEQYAIVLKSNYGEIGGKVWKGFGVIRTSGGKIKLPGHYLLSVLNK